MSILGTFLVLNRDYPWMIPLASVLLFVIPGGVAMALMRFAWLPGRSRIVIFAFGFVAAFGPLGAIPGLADYARAIVAAGVAYQIGRACNWSIPRLRRVTTRPTILLASAAILLAGVMVGGAHLQEFREEQRVTRLGARGPNVVLIVMDTVRAKSTSTFGYNRPTTPNLDRVASEGTAFDLAFSTAPWTLPSHASMFTGEYPHEHGADWSRPLSARDRTLAEVLRDAGYVTAGFSANTLNVTRVHGLARGFVHFEDLPVSLGRLALTISLGRRIVGQGSIRHWLQYHEVADRQPAEQITGNFLSWLETHKTRPFFAFLNYFDAHDPYLPPEPFASRFGPRRRPDTRFWHTGDAAWPADRPKMNEADRRAEVAAYDGAIAYIDAQVGRVVEQLQHERILDNTLLIVVSDHGEQLGEHGLFNHGNSLYRPVVHVPLVLRFPGKAPAGLRVSSPVSLRDLPATVLDLLARESGSLPGVSLARLWQSTAGLPSASPVLIEGTRRPFGQGSYPLMRGDMIAIVDGGYQYIHQQEGGQEELQRSRVRPGRVEQPGLGGSSCDNRDIQEVAPTGVATQSLMP